MEDLTSGSLTFARLVSSVRELSQDGFERQVVAALQEPVESLSGRLLPAIRSSSTWSAFRLLRRIRRLQPSDPLAHLELRLCEAAVALRSGADFAETAALLCVLAGHCSDVLANRTLRYLWGCGGVTHRLLAPSARPSSSIAEASAATERIAALAGLARDVGKERDLGALRASVEPARDTAGPEVSVIVVAFDEPDLVATCAAVVGAVPAGVSWELVIANNGPTDARLEAAAVSDDRVRVIEINTNRGFGEACNIAAERSAGTHLVFLNADVFVADGWLRTLRDAYEADGSIGILGATLVSPEGTVQEAGCVVDAAGYVWQSGRGSELSALGEREAVATDHVSAACTMVSRELFDALGGFDFRYFPAYCEDLDLCLKARSVGLQVAYSEMLRVLHVEHGGDTSDARMGSIQAMVARNRLEILRRWNLADSVEAKRRYAGFDSVSATTRSAVVAEARVTTGALRAEPSRLDVSMSGDTVALHTAVDVNPGEAFAAVIDAAARFAKGGARVAIVTPAPWSKLRVVAVAEALGRPLGDLAERIALQSTEEAGLRGGFDVVYLLDKDGRLRERQTGRM